MTLASRLKERMDALGLSQAELARQLGLAQPTIAKLLSGQSRSSTHMHRIARALKTTPAYLTGEADNPETDAMPKPVLEMIMDQFGLMLVPFGSVGVRSDDGDSAGVSTTAVDRRFVGSAMRGDLKQLFAFKVSGDAMEPTLRNGELCLIDSSQDEVIEQDQIWLVSFGGHGALRRVRRVSEHRYKVMADNPHIADVEVESSELLVAGRAIWRGGVIA